MKVLCIDKGLGFSKRSYLKQHVHSDCLLIVAVPEPTQSDVPLSESTDFQQGVQTLQHQIQSFQPDVILSCSRGGKYLMELLDLGIWNGPSLFVAAMAHKRIVPKGVPILFVHGTQDKTIPVHSVNMIASTGTSGLVKLIQVDDDDHSMNSTENENSENNLISLLNMVIQMGDKDNIEKLTSLDNNLSHTSHQRMAAINRQNLFSEIIKKRN